MRELVGMRALELPRRTDQLAPRCFRRSRSRRLRGRETVVQFGSVEEAEGIVGRIVAVARIVPRFVVEEGSDSCAHAVIHSRERIIASDPGGSATLNRATGSHWPATAVLAHEEGPHLNAPTLDGRGSYPTIELEADEIAGFALQRLGPALDDVEGVARIMGERAGHGTHPLRRETRLSLLRGWHCACAMDASCARRSAPPRPEPRDRPASPGDRADWPDGPTPARSRRVTDRCSVRGEAIVVRDDGQGNGVRLPPLNPWRCIFDLRTGRGRACVERTGAVSAPDRYGRWRVIGQCRECVGLASADRWGDAN